MLIITQALLKMNSMFSRKNFPVGRGLLKSRTASERRGWSLMMGSLRPRPGRDGPHSCSQFLGIQRGKPHQAMSEVVPLMSLSGLLLLPATLWRLS